MNLALTYGPSKGACSRAAWTQATNSALDFAPVWNGAARFELVMDDASCHEITEMPDGTSEVRVLEHERADCVVFRVKFCRAASENAPHVREIRWKLPRVKLNGSDVLITPQTAGMRYENPDHNLLEPAVFHRVSWKDRMMNVMVSGTVPPEEAGTTERTLEFKGSMQYLSYGSEAGSIYIASHDAGFENTFFGVHADRNQPGIELTIRKVFNRDLESWQGDFVLGLHAGDWHESAAIYRAFFDQTGRRIRHSSGLLPGMCCHYDFLWQNGDINHRFCDIAELGREARTHGFDTILVSAWNKGGFDTNYPEFRPDPKLGSEEDLKKAVAELQNQGGRVLFYINGYSFDRDSPGFAELGAAAAVRHADGSTVDVRWGSRILSAMCSGSSLWREKVLDNIRYLVEEIHADGVYIDQLNVLPPVCHAAGHDHSQSVLERNADWICEARRRFGESVILISEWATDLMACVMDSQLLQGVWRSQENAFPEMFRYTFPEAGTIDMVLQKPWAGDDPTVEGAFVQDVYEKLFLCGIDLWCYDHAPCSDGFQELFKLGVNLRNQYREAFLNGRFLHTVELDKVPDGIQASTFALPEGARMLVVANRTGQDAVVGLKNNVAVTVSSDRLSVNIIS